MQIATVYSCVDLISGAMACMDLHVYEQLFDTQLNPEGERLAWSHDIYDLLHDEPNIEMTSYTWRRTAQAHALLWTNSYTEIERDKGNRPIALWPRSPNATRPIRTLDPITYYGDIIPAGTMVYVTTDGPTMGENQSGKQRVIAAEDMIHVPGLSLDGRIGKPVIELTRQVMGLALAAEKFGGKFFANGIRPSGVFTVPNDMTKPAMDNFRVSIQEAYGGENMMRPVVSETGIEFKPYEVKPNEAQFLETRKHQREEMAAIFHVPIRMLGEGGRVNRASAEQEAIELVQYTLIPWVKAWQPELKRKLFPKRGRTAARYFPGFDYQEMLTPDSESRGKLISLLKQWGIASTDDIRRKFFRWNPIGGKAGTTYWMPVNMMDAEHPLELAPPDPAAKASGEDGDGSQGAPPKAKTGAGENKRALPPFLGMFQQRTQAILQLSRPDLRAFNAAFSPILEVLAGCEVILNPLSAGALVTDSLSSETQEFISDYVGGMFRRFDSWKSDPAAEFGRAVRAVHIAVARDLATQNAKRENERLLEAPPQ